MPIIYKNPGTTSTGGTRLGKGTYYPSYFDASGKIAIPSKYLSSQSLADAVSELQSNVETKYAALSDSASLLNSADQVFTKTGSQPIYAPDPGSNWLIWGLLAGLVVLYLVFSK